MHGEDSLVTQAKLSLAIFGVAAVMTGLIASGAANAENAATAAFAAHAKGNDLFEITLAKSLADEPRGWCIDAAGHQVNAIMAGGAHGHTCYSYEGNGKFRVAEDQGFSMKSIKEQNNFRLVYFNHCLTVSVSRPGSWIAYTPCDGRREQGFRLLGDGRIQSTLDPALCVTLGTQVIPGGGGSPLHQIRKLTMQPCSDDLCSLQQWRLRNHRDQ